MENNNFLCQNKLRYNYLKNFQTIYYLAAKIKIEIIFVRRNSSTVEENTSSPPTLLLTKKKWRPFAEEHRGKEARKTCKSTRFTISDPSNEIPRRTRFP